MTDPNDAVRLRHPAGKHAPNVQRSVYEPTRTAILQTLSDHPNLLFTELREQVEQRTTITLWTKNSLGWYTTAVKLDLEARGLIKRAGQPQCLELTDSGRAALDALRCTGNDFRNGTETPRQ
ncbi:hypothetical protein [Brevibacterium sp.]|uniref:DUF6958 family protein n=1 Tax=Brevibacterium sp. TaxID=1701 RepID=UPI0035C7CF05